MPNQAEILKAIATIENSRNSHVTWAEWYRQHPEHEVQHAETCGDSAWHARCIAEYDHVLAVLRAFLQPAAY